MSRTTLLERCNGNRETSKRRFLSYCNQGLNQAKVTNLRAPRDQLDSLAFHDILEIDFQQLPTVFRTLSAELQRKYPNQIGTFSIQHQSYPGSLAQRNDISEMTRQVCYRLQRIVHVQASTPRNNINIVYDFVTKKYFTESGSEADMTIDRYTDLIIALSDTDGLTELEIDGLIHSLNLFFDSCSSAIIPRSQQLNTRVTVTPSISANQCCLWASAATAAAATVAGGLILNYLIQPPR